MEKSIRKQVILRNVRFWGGSVEKTFLMVLGISVLYAMILPLLVNDAQMAGAELFMIRASYAVMMEGIMLWVLPIVYPSYYLPFVLSLGAGRKESFFAMQCTNLLVAGQILAMIGVFEWIGCHMEGEHQAKLSALAGVIFAVSAGIILLIAAIGQFGTAMILRFGGKGMAVYIILFILMIFGAVLAIVLTVGAGQVEDAELLSVLYAQGAARLKGAKGAIGILIALGAAVYAGGYAVLRRTVMHYEVRI